MGMFDDVTIFMPCPKCNNYIHLPAQTKDLECLMHHYRPLEGDWFTSDSAVGGKKFREGLPVFLKFPKDKEANVWKDQAERIEAEASLAEPYASGLKHINAYGTCPKCGVWLEGKVRVENGMLIGGLIDVLLPPQDDKR